MTDLMSTFSTTAMEVEQTIKMETVFILRVLGSSLGSFPMSETTYPGRCPYSRSLQEDLEILARPLVNKPPPSKGLNIRIPIIIPTKEKGFINQGSGLYKTLCYSMAFLRAIEGHPLKGSGIGSWCLDVHKN